MDVPSPVSSSAIRRIERWLDQVVEEERPADPGWTMPSAQVELRHGDDGPLLCVGKGCGRRQWPWLAAGYLAGLASAVAMLI